MGKKAIERVAIGINRKIGEMGISDADKHTLQKIVEAEVEKAEVPNTAVYRLAVTFMGVIALALILGATVIAIYPEFDGDIPDFYAVAVGAAIGALAGMLVPSGGS